MTAPLVVLGLLAALFGLPLFLVVAFLALVLFASIEISGSAVAIEMLRLAGSPLLVALPLFTFAGAVLAESGAPRRLLAVARALVGWLPGGLPLVALLTCALFTAFTGASGVTILAVGGLLYPALISSGYPERFTLGLITTSGSLGLLFPPSLPLIIYAYVAGTPIDALFLAGIVPGVILILLLALYGARRPLAPAAGRTPFRWGELRTALRHAAWEVPLPLVVLGGIYSGRVTVMEAGSLTALYALFVEMVVYRDLRLRDLPHVVRGSMVLVAGILVIVAAAFGLTNYLIDADVPMQILEWMQGAFSSKWTFLIALNIFLLIVGALLDVFSALIVVLPLIVPIAEGYGVNLTHLGIIFLTNLEIGYSLPPLGLNLFISSFRFEKSIWDLYRSCLPFLAILALALLLITYGPSLSLFLPELMGRSGVG
ncbi:MAG: TRAP transporter large permease, partial [Candidatus Eiseniibacteriota bacterium]